MAAERRKVRKLLRVVAEDVVRRHAERRDGVTGPTATGSADAPDATDAPDESSRAARAERADRHTGRNAASVAELLRGPDRPSDEEFRRLRLEIIAAQRDALLEARDDGIYSSAVLGHMLETLDADQISMELRVDGDAATS